jgi:hypothetical protein
MLIEQKFTIRRLQYQKINRYGFCSLVELLVKAAYRLVSIV